MKTHQSYLKSILILCLIVSVSAVKAQYVSIPDSGFGNWLYHNGYSSCLLGNNVSGYQLDTTCSAVLTDTLIIIDRDSTVFNLMGIQYFKGLLRLYCNRTLVDSIPVLPPNIYYLDCSVNELTHLPTLPLSLQYLDCSFNKLTSLPSPDSMLMGLDCNNNYITRLPMLPPLLRSLFCGSNQLTSLPFLPIHLNQLVCTYNQLTSLPPIPDSLRYLDCGYNFLTTLPSLPDSMYYISVQYNPITYLPVLPPNLRFLDLTNDIYLTCLPLGLKNVETLFYGMTQITCMPYRFSVNNWLGANPYSLPLCTEGSGCPFSYNIAGNVHQDTSTICMSDSINNGPAISSVKVILVADSQIVQQTYSFGYGFGQYSFKTDNLGTYRILIDTNNLPFEMICPNNQFISVTENNSSSLFTNQNFGLQCKGVDNGVSSIHSSFHKGFDAVVNIISGDIAMPCGVKCSAHSSGIFVTTYRGPVTYIAPANGALTPTIVDSALVYTISDFDSVGYGAFDIVFQIDTNAVISSSVCINTTIYTTGGLDINPSNNTLTQCFTVTNSFDPNSKTVYPTSLTSESEWLTYTIEFQNTGTDTAFTVVVTDTLSDNVDVNSFQYLASSNRAVIQIKGNACIFTFPHINLPDSSQNPSGSIGWMHYKVKTKPNILQTAQVRNTAYIYFDANPAIVTNTTVTTYPSSIQNLTRNSTIHLYPNPNPGCFILESAYVAHSQYSIYDMLGNLISQDSISSSHQQIAIPDAVSGIYTMMVRSEGASQVLKFVLAK